MRSHLPAEAWITSISWGIPVKEPQAGQHHKHQPGRPLVIKPPRRSAPQAFFGVFRQTSHIETISWSVPHRKTPSRPHHENQLGRRGGLFFTPVHFCGRSTLELCLTAGAKQFENLENLILSLAGDQSHPGIWCSPPWRRMLQLLLPAGPCAIRMVFENIVL